MKAAKEPYEMARQEYREQWFAETGAVMPADGELLSVKQLTDERLAREGWVVRVAFAIRDGKQVADAIRAEAQTTCPILFDLYSQKKTT